MRDGRAAQSRVTRPRAVTLGGALALGVLQAACTSAANPGPREVVKLYAQALEEGRVDDAHAWLSDDAKKRFPLEAFRRLVKENPEEALEVAHALVRPSSEAVVHATVTAPDGETLRLVYEDGAWHIEASAIDLYDQSTPRAALLAFLRAFDNRRYDILMRFVPEAKRDGLTPEMLEKAWEGEQKQEMLSLTQALSAALPTARIEEIGNRATMSYGAAGAVEFVEEGGAWRMEEF